MRGGAPAPLKGGARRGRRWLAAAPLAGLAALAMLLAATTADAQSASELRSQINSLRTQIVSLRNQINDLERVVHTGAAPRSTASAAGTGSGVAERNSRRLAALETAIDEVMEWQRSVTGRFEELDNTLRRIEDRIGRLVADVDFRLSALEDRLAGAPDAAAVAPAAEPVATEPVAAEPAAAEPARRSAATVAPGQEGGYEPSDEPRALGTIPAEQPADAAPSAALTPREQYQAAFALLEETRYQDAFDAFSGFVEANTGHELVPNAAYWRAETLYARQMYGEAMKAYAQNLRAYPEGRKAPDNMVKLGLALLRLGRNEEACRTFTQLDRTFPDLALNIRRAAQQGRRQANCP